LCIACGNLSERVAALTKSRDGFELAEIDLRLRGSGELLGTQQSGFSDLRALDPIEDLALLQEVRDAVSKEPS
jgi:ATP-dependent DNA helicase RecG